MALGDRKMFVLTQGGVSAEVWLEDLGNGETQVEIKSLQGTLDINAVFWDLISTDADADNSLAGAGIPNALNMNGVGSPGGLQWDDAEMVSAAGSHDAQINVGESLDAFSISANFDSIQAFGIRAGGNKLVDTTVNAEVDAPVPHLEQRAMFDFESDDVDNGNVTVNGQHLFTQVVPNNWTSANGVVEIQGGLSGYGGHSEYGLSPAQIVEDQYLDTAKSAGNIDITSDAITNITDGAKVQIDISVSPQDLIYPGNGGHYFTDPNASFDLVFNDQLVKTFTMADFPEGTAGNLDFDNFSYNKAADNSDLIAAVGDDHISIVAHGQQDSFTGFSVDHVVVSEWTL